MRNINKVIKQNITMLVEKVAVTEMLTLIIEDKKSKNIQLEIECLDENNVILESSSLNIYGDYYDMLMSDCPNFAPNKPLNEYREEDIWHIIDLIRGE